MTDADFKQCIIDHLVCIGIYSHRHETNPRAALSEIIAWEIDTALDLNVSQAANDIYRQGYEAALKYVFEKGRTDAQQENNPA